MRNPTAVLVAFAVTLTTICVPPPASAQDDSREALDRKQAQLFAALEARDAERTAALFADTATLHVANMPPIHGRDAIRKFYGNMFGFLSASTAVPETTHVSSGGDMAYSIGRVTNQFRGPEGPVEYEGKYALVWVKAGNDWMIELYSVSSNQADTRR
jgi:uncharacterized protein (TIGR02246 family)